MSSSEPRPVTKEIIRRRSLVLNWLAIDAQRRPTSQFIHDVAPGAQFHVYATLPVLWAVTVWLAGATACIASPHIEPAARVQVEDTRTGTSSRE